jgi:pimeloyl-ACP methyl ester carboxylesterase
MRKGHARWMKGTLWCIVAGSFFGYGGIAQADEIIAKDHFVPHMSLIPMDPKTPGKRTRVELFVREVRGDSHGPRKAVLMIHGASVPVLPFADLRYESYDWAIELAKAGLDVFMLDFQGSGLSPRPTMDDPCNVPTAEQQTLLIPNKVLSEPCAPSYPFQLVTSQSDWDELDTVVDFIRKERDVDKVALVSWSQGSFRAGPYAAVSAQKVESLFLFAPIFNPDFRSTAPSPLPQPGTPMSLRTRSQVMGSWNGEPKCEGQVAPGIQDVVWSAIMDNDPIGRTWGGVMRVRTPTLWGWNKDTPRKINVPVLIIAGEHDRGGGGVQKFNALYDSLPPDLRKLGFTVECAGHFMQWEGRRAVLHEISKQWLRDGTVRDPDGNELVSDKYFVNTEGQVTPRAFNK